MWEKLDISFIDRFSQLSVLVVGDVMVDSYIEGNIDRISQEAPVPVVRVSHRENRLGGAANVALNVKSLGAKPILCSVIGDDENGKQFTDRLTARRISADGLVISQTRQTTVKHRVMSGHHHILRVDEESDQELNESESLSLIRTVDELIPECDVIILEDYDKGVLTKDIIRAIIVSAGKYEKPVIVDPKKRNFFHYEGVSVFKPNFKELQEGLNVSLDKNDTEGIKKAVKELHKKMNCGAVLTTLSDKGVVYSDGDEVIQIPAHYRDVTDVSGAGDTVVTVTALCKALGLPSRQIAQLANMAGGIVCEQHGVIPIDKSLLRAEVEKENAKSAE